MKIKLETLIVFLVSVLVICNAGCTEKAKETGVIIEKDFQPLPAGEDELLLKNPDRGFRQETKADIIYLSSWRDNRPIERTYEAMKSDASAMLQKLLEETSPEIITLVQVYVYLGQFNDRDIPDDALMALEAYLDAMSELKLKALLRFAYSVRSDSVNQANQTMMLRHMEQLSPIVHKKKDIIHVYQAGFIGAWGEWHTQIYPVDRSVIIKNILDILVPSDMYVQIRTPMYKKEYLPESHPGYKRVGFNDDALFGKTNDTWRKGSGGWDPGTEAWEMSVREAPYAPQDAELFWSSWCLQQNIFCDGYYGILQLSEQRNTTLSLLHGYKDFPDDETAMQRWKKQPITEEWLKENKITYAPGWFKNKKGQQVERNVFEFVRDFLGYRIEIQNVLVKKNDSKLSVKMNLVNHGFSAAFNLESGFALLDKDNKLISTVESGEPVHWHSRSAEDYSDNTLPVYTLNGTFDMPKEKGKYKLAFYLKNKLGHPARIANQVDFINGYNVLGIFKVK